MNRIRRAVREFFTTTTNVMARTTRTVRRRIMGLFQRPTHDWGRSDYDFWRRAYYCRVRGLEISGVFIKPLVNKIAAWSAGRAPAWKLANERAATALADWQREHHVDVLTAYRAALKQGDAWLVINADLSVTVLTPDSVDPIVADDDYANVIGWRVTQNVPHPENPTARQLVTDEYYADRRVHKLESDGVTVLETTYRNLIGRLPIVHVANQVQDGETYGHPEAEALLETLMRYGVVLEAAVEGNELQGRPTPVISFESQADLDKFWAIYGSTQTHTIPAGDGTTTTETVTQLDVDLSQVLTMSGGTFDYKSPGPFTEDTERLLGLLFYLILEHTEIPEFVFGNAIASSKASAEAQMPVFETFIEMRRADIGGWLTEIAEIALAYLALMTPGVTAEETPVAQWQPMTQDGRLTLDALSWAFAEGLIDERTALQLAPIDLDDIDAVLEQARKEREERRALLPDFGNMDQQLANEINALELDTEGM